MCRIVLWAVAALLFTGDVASAGDSFVLADGLSRAPAMTLHCAAGSGGAAPCGTAAQPIVVAPVAGGATATNQAAEIVAQQSMQQAIGSTSDSAYSGTGAATTVALLKALASSLTTGITAFPAGGQPVSRSMALPAQQSTALFAPNAARRYMAFQAPAGTAIWVNLVGGPAAPNGVDCAYFPAGSFYESGSFVNRGGITVYSPVAAAISAWEG